MTRKEAKRQFTLTSTNSQYKPEELINEFVLHCGFDPTECKSANKDSENRWLIPLPEDLTLELLLNNAETPLDSSLYLGVNVATIPIKRTQDFLIHALEIADALIDAKISIVGHYLVLSNSQKLLDKSVTDLNHQLTQLLQQLNWYKGTLLGELTGLDSY